MLDAGSASARLFGFTVSPLEAAAVAEIVRAGRASAADVGLIVTPNIDHIVVLRHDPRFLAAYQAAALVICDGFPVQYYARWRGIPVPRVTGTDILGVIMQAGFAAGERPFFVLDSDATVTALRHWAVQAGPQAAIATAVPPVGALDDAAYARALADRVRAHAASLLVMGIGAPRSEIFVHEQSAHLPACWALCIGQGVRMQLGLTRRAPPLMRRWHGEWLWRMGQEPRRLAWRYIRGSVLYPLAVLADLHGAAPFHLAGRFPRAPLWMRRAREPRRLWRRYLLSGVLFASRLARLRWSARRAGCADRSGKGERPDTSPRR